MTLISGGGGTWPGGGRLTSHEFIGLLWNILVLVIGGI